MAKRLDRTIARVSRKLEESLQSEYLSLSFRYRTGIEKREINEALHKIDTELGQTLFVEDSSIKPDGGIIEVKDDNDNWGGASWSLRRNIRAKTSTT